MILHSKEHIARVMTLPINQFVESQCETMYKYITNEDLYKSMFRANAINGFRYIDIIEFGEHTHVTYALGYHSWFAYPSIDVDHIFNLIKPKLDSYFKKIGMSVYYISTSSTKLVRIVID